MSPAVAQPRTAVVSGGSRGLGRKLVERLLTDGWRVATFSRDANEFIEKQRESHPDTFLWQSTDMLEPGATRTFVETVDAQFGRIDLLINNAGVLHQGLFLTMASAEVRELLTANLLAPVELTQACARSMTRAGEGVVVTVSSINAIRGYRGVAAYAAAKAGMEGLSRSLARELGPAGIRVCTVTPGFFDSEMTAGVTGQNRQRIQRRTPLGRLGTTEEVVEAVVFLASPAAAFITGQSLVIDGGISC
ncbi:SDR family NAD(P)-dependent oxidoreductase [Actinacidiphila sp. bgisy145]|uniref:SDR family NAD(P)-dependent oxidoreductase n=1 Tax=Actinacidiphila sp. bgisy145 TaxID=3413792 RepID=UPI003EBD25E7